MSTNTTDEFFVGYVDGVPPRTRRFLAAWIAVALFGAIAIAGSAAAVQNDSRPGTFEFGTVRPFAGWIERVPHPVLVVPHPGGQGAASRYLLSAFGKQGADALFETGEASAESWYELKGTLVHRDGVTMVEVATGSVRSTSTPDGAVRPRSDFEDLGTVTRRGEIVDSKCYLGVMKPANAKSHRACAVRCISGGVPPVLLERDARGYATYYLLVDENGGAVNDRVLPLVALPVTVTGRLERQGDLLVLRCDPATIRRTSGE
jgi:hypothetical protein